VLLLQPECSRLIYIGLCAVRLVVTAVSNTLTLWNRVVLKKPRVPQMVLNFPTIFEKPSFISVLKEHSKTCLYPQQQQSRLCTLPSNFVMIKLNTKAASTLSSFKCPTNFSFPTKSQYAHLLTHSLFSTTFCQQYR
jgi:hypothetical protein